MIPLLLLVTICIIQDLICVSGTRNFGQERVVNNLLQNYKDSQRLVRPEKSTEASIGLTLHAINNFDEKTGRLKAIYWFKQSWTDARIAWEDKAVTQILLPVSSLWKPDFKVWNTFSHVDKIDTEALPIIYQNGKVLWIPPAEFDTICVKTDDAYECEIKIGSWAQSAEQINVTMMDNATSIDTEYFQASLYGWNVEPLPSEVVSRYYACCPDTAYNHAEFRFKLSKIEGGVADAANGTGGVSLFLLLTFSVLVKLIF